MVVGCTFVGAEIKPTADTLSDAQKYPTTQNTEPTETEGPEQPVNDSYITVLSEDAYHRVSRLQQSGALKCEFMDANGNIRMSELVFPDGEHEVKITQVGDVIWVTAPNGGSAFYDTARNYCTTGFNYYNVIAFNGSHIACYYPSNAWNIRVIELFDPLADEQVVLIDGMAEVDMPVTAAEFTEGGKSLLVSYLDESDQETTVEVLLDEMMPLGMGYSSLNDLVQEDYIPDALYWANVTPLFDETYTDKFGNEYNIAVPKIEMPGPNIEAINRKIYNDYAANYLSIRPTGGYIGYTSISYKWFINGDILSLVIMPVPAAGYSGQDYDVYNISISKCRLMTDEEVYAASGMENVDVRVAHSIACFAGEYYAAKNAVVNGERVSIYYGNGNAADIGPLSLFEDVLDTRNILSARPYLGRNGDLYVVGCAYTAVGSGENWGDIRVDDYYTDRLYSAWQYCMYFGESTGQRAWVEEYDRVSAENQVSYTPNEDVVPNVTELVGAELNANYHIPQIVLPGPNVEAINREIYQDYCAPVYSWISAVDYEWTVNGDILSVTIMGTEESGRIQMQSAYNISVSQCRLLSDAEVYAAAGLDPEVNVLHAVSMATLEMLSDEDLYQSAFNFSPGRTVSLLNLWQDAKMMDMITPYFNSEGELCVFAPLYKSDGSMQLTFATWSTICVSDYPTDQLYEPLDYFYAYYKG